MLENSLNIYIEKEQTYLNFAFASKRALNIIIMFKNLMSTVIFRKHMRCLIFLLSNFLNKNVFCKKYNYMTFPNWLSEKFSVMMYADNILSTVTFISNYLCVWNFA